VTTGNLLAQRFFDQGLRWMVGYNFKLALANFLQCQTLDLGCAMCAWGEAMCRGQNLNEFMDLSQDNVGKANEAIARAATLNARAREAGYAVPGSLEVEREMIEAARLRFASEPKLMELGPARTALNEKYADAMARVAERHPAHEWVLYFAAEAQMITMPWNYWEEMLPAGRGKTLRPRLVRARSYLETVLKKDPKHAGALHLELHLFEASDDVARAVKVGEALERLHIGGSEHLLHMPSHGYLRAGRFADAIRTNVEAAAVLTDHAYPQHNVEFLVYSHSAMRQGAEAKAAAAELNVLANRLLETGRDGYEAIFPYERFVVAPLYTAVLFSDWAEVAARTNGSPPNARRVFERVFWRWARGHLLVSRGDTDAAEVELAGLREEAAKLEEPIHVARYSGNMYPTRPIARVLRLYLEASLAKKNGRPHLPLLREAADVPFYYDEPPSLFFPAEIVWALEARDEEGLRAALETSPGNRWILDAAQIRETFV
jgi:hypothetical protein